MSLAAEQERLSTYHPFDEDVLEKVAEVAERQRASSWEIIRQSLPAISSFVPKHGRPTDVLDIIPRSDYDGVYMYHTPMSLPLDENMMMRVATLAAAEPSKRIIAIGNPGAPGQNSGTLRGTELTSVWLGNLRATVEPSLEYLNKQGLEHTTQIGFSYGADKAAAAAQHAALYDQCVNQGIFMEPASVKARSLLGLARDFNSAAPALDGYVQATDSQPYFDARKLAEKRGHRFPGYILGLLRMSNIAISHALAKDGFEARVEEALLAQDLGRQPMRANLVWGSESELATHGLMLGIARRLEEEFGVDRVKSTIIEGHKHAMGDDLFLHTALVLQALKLRSVL